MKFSVRRCFEEMPYEFIDGTNDGTLSGIDTAKLGKNPGGIVVGFLSKFWMKF